MGQPGTVWHARAASGLDLGAIHARPLRPIPSAPLALACLVPQKGQQRCERRQLAAGKSRDLMFDKEPLNPKPQTPNPKPETPKP